VECSGGAHVPPRCVQRGQLLGHHKHDGLAPCGPGRVRTRQAPPQAALTVAVHPPRELHTEVLRGPSVRGGHGGDGGGTSSLSSVGGAKPMTPPCPGLVF
jgi:hypothetical protein